MQSLVTCEELKVGAVHTADNIPRMRGWYGAQKLALHITLNSTDCSHLCQIHHHHHHLHHPHSV